MHARIFLAHLGSPRLVLDPEAAELLTAFRVDDCHKTPEPIFCRPYGEAVISSLEGCLAASRC